MSSSGGSSRIAVFAAVVIGVAVVISAVVLSLAYSGALGIVDSTTTRNSGPYSVGDFYAVSVKGVDNSVVVQPSDSGSVFLTTTVTAAAPFGSHPAVQIISQAAGNSITFTVDTPTNSVRSSLSTLYLPLQFTAQNLSISVLNGYITVNSAPIPLLNANLQSTNGNLILTTVTSVSANLTTVNGNIELAVSGGSDVTASTINGNVYFSTSGAISSGSIRLYSDNGNIAIGIDSQSNVTVSAVTVNGFIHISYLRFSSVTSSATSFSGVLGSGSAELQASTTNGNVTLS